MRYDELTAKLNKPDKIPTGYKTSRDWAKDWNKSMAQTQRVLSSAVTAGLADRAFFKTKNADSVFRATQHYRFKS